MAVLMTAFKILQVKHCRFETHSLQKKHLLIISPLDRLLRFIFFEKNYFSKKNSAFNPFKI